MFIEKAMLLNRLEVLALLTSLACSRASGAGDGATKPGGLSKCIEDWPQGPEVTPALAAPLSVQAPGVLWRTPIHTGGLAGPADDGGLVLSSHGLAVATGTGIIVVDKTGNYTQLPGWVGRVFNFASSLTTDSAGNMYFTAPSGTYALTPEGNMKWAQLEGAVAYGEGHPGSQMGTPLALDPDGVLYGVAGDLQMRAFRAADGAVLWRHSLGLAQGAEYASSSLIFGGAGSAVFARIGVEATTVVDRRDGSELGRLRLENGTDLAGSALGWALSYRPRICVGNLLFDTCGHLVSHPAISKSLGGPAGGIAIGLLDRFEVTTWSVDSRGNPVPQTDQMSLYDTDGNVTLGPKPGKGGAVALGADGTLYAVNCKYSNPPENRLYAYSQDLDELWHLDLGKNGYCPMGNGVLDDDGVLYLVIDDENRLGSDVMAIQTQSPGLAPSAWPMIRHDNRGTMWLVSAPPAAANSDASATADALTPDTSPDDVPVIPIETDAE